MGNVAPVLIITGTRREAAVIRGAGIKVLTLGGVADGLAGDHGPYCGVISFGMAGALSPELRIGDWVIGSRTCGPLEMECDAPWQAALANALPKAWIGPVYADGRLIGDAQEKRSLSCRHNALAADMESHFAAEQAARYEVPFAILRCISDEAVHALPPAIAVAMRPDGGLALGNVLRSIAVNPGQVLDILSTLTHFSRAYAALRRGVASLPERLAFDLR